MKSTVHTTEYAARVSSHANQGRSFLKVAGENEGRPQQGQ